MDITKVTEIGLDISDPFNHRINYYIGDELMTSEKVNGSESKETFNKIIKLWTEAIKDNE